MFLLLFKFFSLCDYYIVGAFHRLSHLTLITPEREKSFLFPFQR